MKNSIRYFYNIVPENIHRHNNVYKFMYNNEYYSLYPYNGSSVKIKDIYNLSVYLNSINLYCHQIIININREVISVIENVNYILLKYDGNERKISWDDVINFSSKYIIKPNNNIKKDWHLLWIKKTDYVEYQINQFGIKYSKIRESSRYFFGMAENAISYIKDANLKFSDGYNRYVVAHERIKADYTIFDLYNPINFVIDYYMRDICEYLKDLFFYKNGIEFTKYLSQIKFNSYELYLIIARLMYPTFYFDFIQECINGYDTEENINKYVLNIDMYEEKLADIIKFYSDKFYYIEPIEWITKKWLKPY